MNDYTKMGNEEIGEFCRATHRKLAKDVYAIATAIKVVHDRIGGKKGEFGAWRQKYLPFLSKATVYRYLAIADLDPAQIGENEGITELYRRLSILPAKPPAKTATPSDESGVSTTTAVAPAAIATSPQGRVKAVATPYPADECGMAVPTTAHTPTGGCPSHAEDTTPEEDDLRDMELAAALVVAGRLAAKHGVSGDPQGLVAFLGEFGVTQGDIGALASALAAE